QSNMQSTSRLLPCLGIPGYPGTTSSPLRQVRFFTFSKRMFLFIFPSCSSPCHLSIWERCSHCGGYARFMWDSGSYSFFSSRLLISFSFCCSAFFHRLHKNLLRFDFLSRRRLRCWIKSFRRVAQGAAFWRS